MIISYDLTAERFFGCDVDFLTSFYLECDLYRYHCKYGLDDPNKKSDVEFLQGLQQSVLYKFSSVGLNLKRGVFIYAVANSGSRIDEYYKIWKLLEKKYGFDISFLDNLQEFKVKLDGFEYFVGVGKFDTLELYKAMQILGFSNSWHMSLVVLSETKEPLFDGVLSKFYELLKNEQRYWELVKESSKKFVTMRICNDCHNVSFDFMFDKRRIKQ